MSGKTTHLTAEIGCARELLQTLQQEYRALTRGDIDGIESASRSKQEQMQRLQQQMQHRDHLLRQQGLPPGPAGMEQWLERLDDADATTLWHELQQLAERLQEQNEINGGLVALSQRQVRQALELLGGRSGGSDTYGPAGGHHPGHRSQTLARA